MIEQIKRCGICKSEKCSGKEFLAEGDYTWAGPVRTVHFKEIVCRSHVRKKPDGSYIVRDNRARKENYEFRKDAVECSAFIALLCGGNIERP